MRPSQSVVSNIGLMRARRAVGVALVLCLSLAIWVFCRAHASSGLSKPSSSAVTSTTGQSGQQRDAPKSSDLNPTKVYAHNLMLRKGPSFRIYVRWLRGEMARARKAVNPTFDDPESFSLDIKTGVIRANIGDIANYLNSGALGDSPLRNIKLSGDGDQV